MGFDPLSVDDDTEAQGHLDQASVLEILRAVHDTEATGRLTIDDSAGPNHMYFMRGQPVGVTLSEFFHPLGQLLLELGRIDAQVFVRAQRLIAEGNRLPGQVFKEIGVLDDDTLKEVLAVQTRRKVEHFCRLGSRPFRFGRGLSFLAGFQATPLNAHAVTFLALRQRMGPSMREAYFDELDQVEVRLPEGDPGLPAPLEEYEFGTPEERFLTRLASGWQDPRDLVDTGTLPKDEMCVLLRYLDLIGRLQTQPAERDAPPPEPAPPAKAPVPRVPDPDEDVFSSTAPQGAPSRADPSATTQPRGAAAAEAADSYSGPGGPPPPKKKRRKRRAAPEPSVGQVVASETRKEKTVVAPLPTIVIDE